MTPHVSRVVASSLRVIFTWLVVCSQLASSLGLPVLMPTAAKDTSRPYPCMNRPCGCKSYEECWAGDCCCFTLREKIAWADANAIAPPRHAVAKAAKQGDVTPKPNCALCSTKDRCPTADAAGVTWVSGVFAQKCHGDAFAGLSLVAVAVPPAPPFVLPVEPFEVAYEPLVDHLPPQRSSPPDAPPPRA